MTASSATASSAMPPGTRLGEFEITGVIGEGGFGIVYSARDSSLDRIVAIKEYLPSAFASRTTAGTVQVRSEEHTKTFNAGLSSFINEARMLAKFSHPGLVEVFRFWEGNGTAYMAMRYYRGVTLREMLRTNPQVVTEQWLCETLDPILLALQELHNEKCYHRDIAPDNILVLPNGRSVLMDFGAARRIIGGMTRALTTVLKPGYAPIEQYSDDGSMQQGAWTDIYAVGGVLYHAMTGKVPVQAISRMMNDPLKPVAAAARGTYSDNLCAVVMKCLAVMPENRYQSVDELRAALGWVTTPVSSTVILQRTTYANAADSAAANLARSAAVAPATPAPSAPLPAAASAAGSVDPLAALIGSPPSAPKPAPAQFATPVALRGSAPATAPAIPESKPAAGAPPAKKSNVLPIAVLAFAALAVVGSAAYLMMSRGDNPGEPPIAVAPPSAEPKAAKAPDVAPPGATPAVEPATSPPANTTPLPAVDAPKAPSSVPDQVATKTAEAPGTASPLATPDKPAVGELGKVDLRIKPWGSISVDGVAKGASPPTMQLSLPPGTHTIVIQNPAGPPVTRTVDVVAGKSVTVRHTF